MHFLRYCIVLAIMVWAFPAHAATISFDPQEKSVGTSSPFEVGLLLTSAVPVNTLHIEVVLPEGLTPLSISDGNSIVNFWITNPVFDEASRTLTFEGSMPGGFSGEDGRLLVLTLSAQRTGIMRIDVNRSHSVLYRNGPSAIAEPIETVPLLLDVSSAHQNLANELPDAYAPESFTPAIARFPDDAWMLMFATQDKGSGIDHYEVRESLWGIIPGRWTVAESPYRLRDQSLASALDVRAVDRKGNSTVEHVSVVYPRPWYENARFTAMLIGGACLLILFLYAVIRIARRYF